MNSFAMMVIVFVAAVNYLLNDKMKMLSLILLKNALQVHVADVTGTYPKPSCSDAEGLHKNSRKILSATGN